MNQGVLLLDSNFFSDEMINRIADRVKESQGWNPIHASGEYATDQWKQVILISGGKPTSELSNFPDLQKIQDWCKTDIDKMVFYALAPGAKLHPHRDLSGTYEFGKLYFHLPIITDPKCKFYVSKKPVVMKAGSIWALNTSYLHAVDNQSDINRVHLVVQVHVNDWVRSLLPKPNWRYYVHYLFYVSLLLWKAMISVLFEPKRLAGRFRSLKQLVQQKLSRAKNQA